MSELIHLDTFWCQFSQAEKKSLSTKAKKYTDNPVNFIKILMVKIKNSPKYFIFRQKSHLNKNGFV